MYLLQNYNNNLEEQNKEYHKRRNDSIFLCNSAKFSTTYKGNKVQIFGGQSIANCCALNENNPSENYAIVTNILHSGIGVYLPYYLLQFMLWNDFSERFRK